RDLYPGDMLRRRYITKAWRDVSIRCGFEEIDGPTFEAADLYSIKSGEGILGELFQAYSGKSPEEVEQVQASGRAPFAMRPEFTPTLARMYAAKANSLPTPCKWFSIGPYFRAERPQRGRLREFLQWNVDVIGDESPHVGDAEIMRIAALCCACFGLSDADAKLKFNHRDVVRRATFNFLNSDADLAVIHAVLDKYEKIGNEARTAAFVEHFGAERGVELKATVDDLIAIPDAEHDQQWDVMAQNADAGWGWRELAQELRGSPFSSWFQRSASIVRGLAYYTGTVFELIADGERALAGGGRYDNLIELMGGPPTPAVGFAMGDVVLELVLQDRGLMPEGNDLLDAVSAPGASLRPEVFCIAGGDPEAEAPVRRLAADLRRGIESKAHQDKDDAKPWDRDRYDAASDGVRPMHARTTYKATRNLKKLLSDAEKQFARFAAIVENDDEVKIRDLDDRKDIEPSDVHGMPGNFKSFSAKPGSPVYVGRAVQALTH
ncbi:MAG: ATP phosphoribosyltransferase regulatory subunit, partial [Planctomycetota bacterium]